MKLECVNDLNTESMTAKADVFIADLLCDLISSNFFNKSYPNFIVKTQ